MKKNTIKAFTLVEMLIVIVIIGILIAALMPRMQSAQGRARDVARKNALSQIQTAIVTSQQDKWRWPWTTWTNHNATWWMAVSWITTELTTAWMTSVPTDPILTNVVSWLWDSPVTWSFLYIVTKRNGTKDGWFALMAKTEVEWWSNWVYCNGWTANCAGWMSCTGWKITNNTDISKLTTCTKFEKNDNNCWINTWTSTCYYTWDWQLRYVLFY